MKTKISCYLLLAICYFTSCSSDSDKNKEDEANGKAGAIDSSQLGLARANDENPPVMNGDYIARYPNGIVKVRGFYVNGKREGQWTSFFENGNVQSEGFFKNNLRDGKATVYYPNGKKYYEGSYKEGKQTGTWIFYDEEGKVLEEKNYDKVIP